MYNVKYENIPSKFWEPEPDEEDVKRIEKENMLKIENDDFPELPFI